MNVISALPGRNLNESGVAWLATFLGVLLATWMVLQAHGAINSDGLLYIEVARLFAAGEWQEGSKLYPAPLYPFLIFIVHKISGLQLQWSAHVLAIVAFGMTSGGLMVLVRAVGGDRNTMIAAMLLLFASPYLVGDVLPMILRDQLFWAVHLWSLVFFIRYYREPILRDALSWGSLAALAVLLRVEALIYLLLLPMVFLADSTRSWRDRWLRIAGANRVLFGLLLFAVAVYILFPGLRMERFSRLHDPFDVAFRVADQLTHGLDVKSRLFGQEVLGKYLKDYAFSGLLFTLGYALLTKALSSAGWLQLVVALLGRTTRFRSCGPSFNAVFVWLIVLGLVNGVFIILAHFLLPKRYLIPIAFVILVFAAFGLRALYDMWRTHKFGDLFQRWATPGIFLLLAGHLLVLVWPAYEKNPEIEAARWLSLHASEDSRIYYDSRRVRYYATGDASDRTKDDWPVVLDHFGSDAIRQFDYMVVRIPKRNSERQDILTRQAGAEPLAVFDNGRGDKVLIYHVSR